MIKACLHGCAYGLVNIKGQHVNNDHGQLRPIRSFLPKELRGNAMDRIGMLRLGGVIASWQRIAWMRSLSSCII
eukprot:4628787-Pyramimonas_sp.AAC.1